MVPGRVGQPLAGLRRSPRRAYCSAMASLDSDTTLVTPESIRKFADRYLEAWNERDPNRMAPLVTEDIDWTDPALPEPARGLPAVQAFLERAGARSRTSTSRSRTRRTCRSTARASRGPGGCRARCAVRSSRQASRPTGRGWRSTAWTSGHARRPDRHLPRLLRHDRPRPAARIMPPSGSRAERATVALQRLQARAAAPGLMADDYDVESSARSTAGCTAARLLGLQGARVAMIERRPARDAYKTVCTHYIQSSATPHSAARPRRADRGARREPQRRSTSGPVRRLDPDAATRPTATTSLAARSIRCCVDLATARPASTTSPAGRWSA